jgi:Adenylate and Guanylate cyclase catalytic domain/Double zinc ribbon
MKCPRCQHENRPGAKFCEECGAPLARACVNCGAQLSATAKFCSECAHPAGPAAPVAPQRFGAPEAYTPKHLAEKILSSKTALEGERKHVTVLFADLKGSMELLADRDPEEARKLLDPVIEHMMEAVHRYEGTVNQVMGDGIMALFGAPLAHEDHAVRACYAALRMQESVKKYADEVRRSHAVVVKIRVGAEFRGSRCARHRQRSPHGLHGRRPDDAPGRANGADRRSRHDRDHVPYAGPCRRIRRGEHTPPGGRQGPR